jgi:hypothetical protein
MPSIAFVADSGLKNAVGAVYLAKLALSLEIAVKLDRRWRSCRTFFALTGAV